MTSFYLSDAQLAQMRSDVARMLPGTAIIQSVTTTSDGMGGNAESWAAVTGGTVACRFDPITTSTRQVATAAGAEGFKVDFQVTLPYNAPIDIGNRIVYDSKAYEVRQLSDIHSWNVSVRAQVARVE